MEPKKGPKPGSFDRTKKFRFGCFISRASLIAQLVKNSPAMQETLVQFLRWEDPLEKG